MYQNSASAALCHHHIGNIAYMCIRQMALNHPYYHLYNPNSSPSIRGIQLEIICLFKDICSIDRATRFLGFFIRL